MSKRTLMLEHAPNEHSTYDIDSLPAKDAYGRDGKGRRIEVRYSAFDDGWSNKNKLALTLHDDGNGVTLKTKEGALRLNYLNLDQLRIALSELEKDPMLSAPRVFEIKAEK